MPCCRGRWIFESNRPTIVVPMPESPLLARLAIMPNTPPKFASTSPRALPQRVPRSVNRPPAPETTPRILPMLPDTSETNAPLPLPAAVNTSRICGPNCPKAANPPNAPTNRPTCLAMSCRVMKPSAMPSAKRWTHGVTVCTALESLVQSFLATGFNAVVHLVDGRCEHVERVTQSVQRRGRVLLAHTGQCCLDVGHSAGEGLSGRQRGSAEVLVQRGGERGEVHLAFGDHLRHVLGRYAQLVGERLQHGRATAGELEHVVALQLAARHHGCEDRARVAEAHAGDLRRVAHGLQHLRQLLARLDAAGDGRCGHGGGFIQPVGGALHGHVGVRHDLADGLGGMAQALQLGRRVLDVQSAGETALRRKRRDAAADGADGSQSELTDFGESLAGGFDQSFGQSSADFGGGGLHVDAGELLEMAFCAPFIVGTVFNPCGGERGHGFTSAWVLCSVIW